VLEIAELGVELRAGVPGCATVARVLHGVTLRVEPGEAVVVHGTAGAGKSVLLQCAAGLRRPSVGTVRVGGLRAADALHHGLLAYAPLGVLGTPAPGARVLVVDVPAGSTAPSAVARLARRLRARAAGVSVLLAARSSDAYRLAGALPGSRLLALRGGCLEAPPWPVLPWSVGRVAEQERASVDPPREAS
jgi:energy-coupling factor transporter ATP-binding protein EcfA2